MRFFIVVVFLFITTLANGFGFKDINNTTIVDLNSSSLENILPKEELDKLQKVIYLSYEKTPKRVLKGEISTVTIKALATVESFTDIVYTFADLKGLKLLNRFPSREIDSKYYHDTFYFLTTSDDARLPNFTATLLTYGGEKFKTTSLAGTKLNVVALNPKKTFSNVIANSFELIDYKTTNYDKNHNIVVFVAIATNADIASLSIKGIYKQGIESVTESYFDSKITYYVVIDKRVENFSFSYFNLLENRFIDINIPIIVDDDSVTTQSDLKPKNQSREMLKLQIVTIFTLILLMIILWRKKYWYLLLLIFPLAYIASIGLPSKVVCIKEGSDIQLLPVSNGTIFETTPRTYHLQKEGKSKDFVKVKLQNSQIGWIKNEDICTY